LLARERRCGADRGPDAQRWFELLADALELEGPEGAEHDVAEEEDQQEQPVGVEELLGEAQGGHASEELEGSPLRRQRQVGVEEGGLVERQGRHQRPAEVEQDGPGGGPAERQGSGQKCRVTGVDPEAVVAHGPAAQPRGTRCHTTAHTSQRHSPTKPPLSRTDTHRPPCTWKQGEIFKIELVAASR
jgi:hypothetical protein